MNAVAQITTAPRRSITAEMAERYGMEPDAFERTIRATCMESNATREEFAALMVVAREYRLNPLTREIFAFRKKGGGIIPIVSIDGWVSLTNSHPAFDGMEFIYSDDDHGSLRSVTCRIFRKDRARPVEVTEFLDECLRPTDPWKMKRRMLRHKALIQCARYAFGFSGIYDEDEAERFGEARDVTPRRSDAPPPAPALAAPARQPTPNPEIAAATASAAAVTDAEGLDAHSPPKDGEPSASTPSTEQVEDVQVEEINPEELTTEIVDHYGRAQALSDIDDVDALFAEDMDRLSRNQREAIQDARQAAEARLAPVPEPRQTGPDYEALVAEFERLAPTADTKDKLEDFADPLQPLMDQLPPDLRDRATTAWTENLKRIAHAKPTPTEQATPEAPTVDMSEPAQTVEQYEAQVAHIIATESNHDTIRRWWFRTVDVRDNVIRPSKEQRDDWKKRVFDRIAKLQGEG